jgi:pimeloyl-ACP methyl ester carboxylesterase
MSVPAVVFSHGQESGPWGTKIRAMADAMRSMKCRVDSIDYQGIVDPTDRVTRLIAECNDVAEPLILVGSSMGGYVATAAAPSLATAGLFVLAPAYGIPGWPELPLIDKAIPHTIVHGWRDDVVPVDLSIAYAREHRADLHILDGDHRLTDNIDEIISLLKRFVRTVAQY